VASVIQPGHAMLEFIEKICEIHIMSRVSYIENRYVYRRINRQHIYEFPVHLSFDMGNVSRDTVTT
jgi:hypothetical protein